MANVLGELFGDIASAIREKTGDEATMKPAQFPEKISEIETGADVSVVTATAPHVLKDDVFVDADGNPVEGTMPNLGSKIIWWRNRPIRNPEAINLGGIAIVEIEEGYHDGTSGIQLTFEYPKRYTPTKERKRFSSSYSTGMFLGDIDIDPIPDQYQDVTPVTATAEDVRAGKVFVDAEGNAVEGALSGTIADVSGVTATAANVLQGKTIVDADGNEVEGSIPVVETSEVELSVQTPSGAIPVGYYANGVALSVAAKSAAVTPTKETQNLADSFYDRITVDPIPEEYQNVSGVTATAEDVAEGKVIVDAQGKEVVGTLVPGGGGESPFPPGIYWHTEPVPMYSVNRQKWFVLKGELYAHISQYTTPYDKATTYKLVGNTWTQVAAEAYVVNYTLTEYNGLLHLFGNENTAHKTWDGVSNSYTTKNALPGTAYSNPFVQNNRLKIYSYSLGKVLAWNESDDSWEEEYNVGKTYKYINFLDTGEGIYALDSRTLYKYTGTSMELVTTFDVYHNFLFGYDGHIYFWRGPYENAPLLVEKYNPVTNKFVATGMLPKRYDTYSTHVWDGKLRFVSGAYDSSKEGFSCATMYAVDEPE